MKTLQKYILEKEKDYFDKFNQSEWFYSRLLNKLNIDKEYTLFNSNTLKLYAVPDNKKRSSNFLIYDIFLDVDTLKKQFKKILGNSLQKILIVTDSTYLHICVYNKVKDITLECEYLSGSKNCAGDLYMPVNSSNKYNNFEFKGIKNLYLLDMNIDDLKRMNLTKDITDGRYWKDFRWFRPNKQEDIEKYVSNNKAIGTDLHKGLSTIYSDNTILKEKYGKNSDNYRISFDKVFKLDAHSTITKFNTDIADINYMDINI